MRDGHFAVLAGAAFAAGVLAGCAAAPESRPPQTTTIGMADSRYSLKTVNARVGDSLRFRNDDVVDHQVYVPTFGHGVDFGNQKAGQDVVLLLGAPGRFRVECGLHAEMLIDVTVAN